MNEDTQKPNVSTELARERSRQAADRTLMAWVRTALSLIGFGFGIAEFRDLFVLAVKGERPLRHLDISFYFGLSFITLGVLGLAAATIQHWRILQQIKQDQFHYTGFHSLVLIMAILLMVVGLSAIVALLV